MKLRELESFKNWALKNNSISPLITVINETMASLMNEEKGDRMHGITSEINVLQNIKDDSPFSQENTSCQKRLFCQTELFHGSSWDFL